MLDELGKIGAGAAIGVITAAIINTIAIGVKARADQRLEHFKRTTEIALKTGEQIGECILLIEDAIDAITKNRKIVAYFNGIKSDLMKREESENHQILQDCRKTLSKCEASLRLIGESNSAGFVFEAIQKIRFYLEPDMMDTEFSGVQYSDPELNSLRQAIQEFKIHIYSTLNDSYKRG
jgi:hypothetical protein